MNSWSGIDFFIFLIFLLNTLLGMARGGSKEIISIMCVSIALIFTIKFTIPLSTFINSSPLLNDVVSFGFVQNFMRAMHLSPLTRDTLINIGYCLSLLVCFVGIFSICEAVLSYTGVLTVFSLPYALMDRKLGAVLGCTRGFVLNVVFVLLLIIMNINITNSYFIGLLRGTSIHLNSLIIAQAPARYKEILDRKDVFDARAVLGKLENPF